ncbi:hypothetical protein RHMOL_Rhmol05G0282000 [Rhododendron molle]|uniref:Uncharacterized protein n=1 Tax=Rhododendron molle TaxID=49168 RepID=A0ACC0NW73_RHOML|nr:hypothetical protein RHMOL_Rhmol05G0282000 [Rhododendron molle]
MKVFVADKIDVVEASIGRKWECFEAPMIGKQFGTGGIGALGDKNVRVMSGGPCANGTLLSPSDKTRTMFSR